MSTGPLQWLWLRLIGNIWLGRESRVFLCPLSKNTLHLEVFRFVAFSPIERTHTHTQYFPNHSPHTHFLWSCCCVVCLHTYFGHCSFVSTAALVRHSQRLCIYTHVFFSSTSQIRAAQRPPLDNEHVWDVCNICTYELDLMCDGVRYMHGVHHHPVSTSLPSRHQHNNVNNCNRK